MKRRDFLKASVGVSGTFIPGYVLAGLNPCPPSSLSVQGGTSSFAGCETESASALPSLHLISEAPAGTYGWTVGHPFRRGHVMTGVGAEGLSIQCDVRNRWPDGSVKFAVLSGISSIDKVAQVKLTQGSSASGAAIPENRILEILGSKDVTLSLGGYGQVSLRALAGSSATKGANTAGRVRTAISGPVMSEFHYMGIPSGGDAHLRVWFYVRVYANDTMEVETVVENGWLQAASPGQRIYTASLRIMDTVVNVNDGATIQHFHHTRWSRSDWIGGDPKITPRHHGG